MRLRHFELMHSDVNDGIGVGAAYLEGCVCCTSASLEPKAENIVGAGIASRGGGALHQKT